MFNEATTNTLYYTATHLVWPDKLDTYLSLSVSLVADIESQFGWQLLLAAGCTEKEEIQVDGGRTVKVIRYTNLWAVPDVESIVAADSVMNTWRNYVDMLKTTYSRENQLLQPMPYTANPPPEEVPPMPANFADDLLINTDEGLFYMEAKDYKLFPIRNAPQASLLLKQGVSVASIVANPADPPDQHSRYYLVNMQGLRKATTFQKR